MTAAIAPVVRCGRKTCAGCNKPLNVGTLTEHKVERELPGGRNSIGDRVRSFNTAEVLTPWHADCYDAAERAITEYRDRYLAECRAEAEAFRTEQKAAP